METRWFSTTEGGESWQSYQDVLNTIGSIAILTGDKSDICSTDKNSSKTTKFNQQNENKNKILEQFKQENAETSDLSENKLTARDRDAALNTELRLVCGSGYSNELIEQYWSSDAVMNKSGLKGKKLRKHTLGPFNLKRNSPNDKKKPSSLTCSENSGSDSERIGSDIAFKKVTPVFKVIKKDGEGLGTRLNPILVSESSFGETSKLETSFTKRTSCNMRKCRNALLISLQKNCENVVNSKSLKNDDDYFPDFLRKSIPPQPFFPNYDNLNIIKCQPDEKKTSKKDFNLSSEFFPPLS